MENNFNKIMIIDDNHIDLYITSILMKKKCFASEILQYTAAKEALAYLKSNINTIDENPQIILLDIYMPEMSGFEFMVAFNALPENLKERIKVYIVSSSIDQSDINRAKQDKNVVSFQEKPITAEFLKKVTEDQL